MISWTNIINKPNHFVLKNLKFTFKRGADSIKPGHAGIVNMTLYKRGAQNLSGSFVKKMCVSIQEFQFIVRFFLNIINRIHT